MTTAIKLVNVKYDDCNYIFLEEMMDMFEDRQRMKYGEMMKHIKSCPDGEQFIAKIEYDMRKTAHAWIDDVIDFLREHGIHQVCGDESEKCRVEMERMELKTQ